METLHVAVLPGTAWLDGASKPKRFPTSARNWGIIKYLTSEFDLWQILRMQAIEIPIHNAIEVLVDFGDQFHATLLHRAGATEREPISLYMPKSLLVLLEALCSENGKPSFKRSQVVAAICSFGFSYSSVAVLGKDDGQQLCKLTRQLLTILTGRPARPSDVAAVFPHDKYRTGS